MPQELSTTTVYSGSPPSRDAEFPFRRDLVKLEAERRETV
jgi:hypothetical protein